MPDSPVELLTLQSRRLSLIRENDSVTGYLLLGGDIIPKENALIEQMTIWRKNSDDQWIPKIHSSSKAMWRDYQSLLIKSTQDGKHREPGVLRWVTSLVDKDWIPFNSIKIRITGVEYGDKNFFIDNYISDDLAVNRSILSNLGDSWNVRIVEIVGKTEDYVNALERFAGRVVSLSMGVDDKNIISNATSSIKSTAYYNIDQPFRIWLKSIDPNVAEVEETMSRWLFEAKGIVLMMGKEVLNNVGEKAIIGKDASKNAFTFFNYFLKDLREICEGGDNNGKK